MPRDPRAYLWEALEASIHIGDFVREKSLRDYENDLLLRSGVERQLEIIGEALNSLSRSDAELASRVPDLRNIVGLRNILIHGYAEVDDARVWDLVSDHLPTLRDTLQTLLDEREG